MPIHRSFVPNARGFSLIEVMIAVLLLSIYTTAIFGSVMYASKTARVNSNAVMAKNISQGLFEKIAAQNFATITPDNALLQDVLFAEPDTSARKIWLDQSLRIPCQVRYRLTGYGTAEGGSTSSLRDDQANWVDNEGNLINWGGNTVYIVDGSGSGQYAEIASNTSNQLTLRSTLTNAIGNGSEYMINNGKTLSITTTWRYQFDPNKPAKKNGEFSNTVSSLIVPRDFKADLGPFN